MTRFVGGTGIVTVLVFAACGDITRDLITRPADAAGTAGASGSPQAGSSGTGGGAATGGAAGNLAGGESGATAECLDNDACTSGERRVCDPVRHRCVECLRTVHCFEPDEECNPISGECGIRCATSAECLDEDDRICDQTIGFCVECLSRNDCAADQACLAAECVDD